MQNMVIVGAGECGTRAAFALREQGFDGTITLIGAEPYHPYARPPLSKQFLLERDEQGNEVVPYIAQTDNFADSDIRFLAGHRVSAIDTGLHQITVSSPTHENHVMNYDKLLLATGTLPRPLPVPGVAGHPRCLYLRTLADARTIHHQLQQAKQLLIVGGGLIGLELAASARKLGVVVTVLEVAPQVLGRAVPTVFAEMLAARHEQEGVVLRCGVQLSSVGHPDDRDGVTVTLHDGEMLHADLIVIGIGAIPDQALAEQAELTLDNGIVVDEYLQTSAENILAAGDCCCFPCELLNGQLLRLETWRNAQSQGNLAAANMLGKQEKITDIPWFWSDQYDLGLQVAGLSDPNHQTIQRPLKNGALIQFELNDEGRLVAAGGLGEGNSVAKDIRLAEMLIAKGIHPDPEQLADPAVNLKKLLR
ncbi:MAG: FAD-dependent oxidoreductase [Thiolinea sp.]